MDHGYEPSRIATLAQQSRRAADALDDIHSADEAATDAMAAVARLRSVVADGFIPAVTTVGIVDPLGAPARPGPVPPVDGPGAWWDRHQTGPTRFASWSDDELFEAMLESLDWLTDLHLVDRPDHFFWTDDLPELAREFRRRAALAPEFAQRLIDDAGANPMIGLVVAQGGFSDEVLAGVTIATATEGVTAFDSGEVRSFVLDRLLVELQRHTDVALVVLADPEAFERLFTWNEHDHTVRPIDLVRLGAVLTDVLAEPFDDPAALGAAHQVIANVVDLADHDFFDEFGFPPELAMAVVEGIVPYLPFIISSLDDTASSVFIKDFDGDRSVSIGDPVAVADLLGNLLRDPATRPIMIGTVLALTLSKDPDLYSDAALSKYVETLLDAAEIEQSEEQIEARRERERWNSILDVVFSLVDTGLEAAGPKFAAARAQLEWIDAGTRRLVDRIEADDIGLDRVPDAIRIVVAVAIATVLVRSFTPAEDAEGDDAEENAAKGSDAEQRVEDIRRRLDEIGEAVDDDADIEEILRLVLDLEEDVSAVDDRAFDAIDDVRLRPDRVVPARDAGRHE